MTFLLALAGISVAAQDADSLVRIVTRMDEPDAWECLKGDLRVVPQGAGGAKVARADGPFSFRIDLNAAEAKPTEFDLIKLEVKADAHAHLRVSLENHPEPGMLSHWYLFSKARGAFDWETAWIDLRRPEEIKPPGAYKGMAESDPSRNGVWIEGGVADMRRSIQEAGRTVWLGALRFARKAVDLDWDQRRAPHVWEPGKDLIFRYPLTVTNRLDRPLVAVLSLHPMDAPHAVAALPEDRLKLGPGETREVTAEIRLPAAVACRAAPLYAERFRAEARAESIADSAVTILRSSDPVELTVTVPIPEDRLTFPLLGRRKDLPAAVTGVSRPARPVEARPADLDAILDEGVVLPWKEGRPKGFYAWKDVPLAAEYMEALTSLAFRYDSTGDPEALERGTALLLGLAERFLPRRDHWAALPAAEISHGIISRNTLRLGWATGGMRSPYHFERHGMFNDFDLLAPGMAPDARRKVLEGFVVPAAIQMRNHVFGLGNQQDVVNYAVLYAGLASRNWPLVSFAYSSPYGVRGQIRWDFNDDGLAGEGHYHSSALRPILWATELLYARGIDLYDDRLRGMVHSKAAEAIGKPFKDGIVSWLDERRFKGEIPEAENKTEGMHLASAGLTSLRWNRTEATLNWGTHIHRGAPDRCAFAVRRGREAPIGGGNYSRSSLGQSIVIVDESLQNPVPAQVVAADLDGPVQFVQARSDRHFPGSALTRTLALVEDLVLVFDRFASDVPRTVDWCLRYPGGSQTHAEVARGISLRMEENPGSFTDKAGDPAEGVDFGANLKSPGHFRARTDDTWRQENGKFVMLGAPGTEVLAFCVPAAFSASRKERRTGVPVLMARRTAVTRTDFVAAFSPEVVSLERVPAVKADSSAADAVGVRVGLREGRSFTAIVSYEPEGTEVKAGDFKSRARFSVEGKE